MTAQPPKWEPDMTGYRVVWMGGSHAAVRTNEIGEPFRGMCDRCGKTGLTIITMREPCPEPVRLAPDPPESAVDYPSTDSGDEG